MCGRYTLRTPAKAVVEAFGLAEARPIEFAPAVASLIEQFLGLPMRPENPVPHAARSGRILAGCVGPVGLTGTSEDGAHILEKAIEL